MTAKSKETQVIENYLAICAAHSADLIVAAKTLMSQNLPHIAFHMAVAALEEIGKMEMAKMTLVGEKDDDSENALAKMGDQHVKKLFWSIWAPSFGKEFSSADQIKTNMDLAKEAHEMRLDGLYVANDPAKVRPPREFVTVEQATRWIAFADARLQHAKLVEIEELSDVEKANVSWFMKAAKDPTNFHLIFGRPSQDKLLEFKHAKKWIAWIKEQFDEAHRQSIELTQKEIDRNVPSHSKGAARKWQMKVRVHTDSHQVRQRDLEWWNKGIDNIKLHAGNKNDHEMLVDISLPESYSSQTLYWSAWAHYRRFVVALNIGTMGFWWWNIPKNREKYYESLKDLQNRCEVKLTVDKTLKVNWRGGKLDKDALQNVAICHAELPFKPPLTSVFDSYLTGLGFLGVIDVNLRFELNAFESFFNALEQGLKQYGYCSSENDYDEAFLRFISEIAPEMPQEQKDRLLKSGRWFVSRTGTPEKIDLGDVAMIKILCDAYFLRVFRERAIDKVKSNRLVTDNNEPKGS